MNDFSKLEGELQAMEASFKAESDAFSGVEIEQRKKRIAEITSQVAELQKEQQQLSVDLQQATIHLQENQSEFQAAMLRRRQELAAEKAQYASYLGG